MNAETVTALEALRAVCRSVASAETSWNPNGYAGRERRGTLHSPLTGHCLTVAHLVWFRFGGEVVHGMVGGRWDYFHLVDGSHHIWNRIGGEDVDLTSDQYPGGDGWHLAPRTTPHYIFTMESLDHFTRLDHIREFRHLVQSAEKALRRGTGAAA